MASPDLLAQLREERGKHFEFGNRNDPDYGLLCAKKDCDFEWPCPLSRALDCAIALAEESPVNLDDPTEHWRAAVLEVLRKGEGLPLEDVAELVAFAMWMREQQAQAKRYDAGLTAWESK